MKLASREEKLKFAGKVFTMLSDCTTCSGLWRYCLFNAGDEEEVHTRRLAAPIWFCSLYDSLYAYRSILPECREIAVENEFNRIVAWCNATEDLFIAISDLLSTFTQGEQFFLNQLRLTVVHGWLNWQNKQEFTVKYVDRNGILEKRKITQKENTALTLPFYQSGWGLSVDKLAERFLDDKIDTWLHINFLIKHKSLFHREIYEDIGVSI